MNLKNDLTQSVSGQARPTPSPAPRKRFSIQKLEARIAPSRSCKGPHGRMDPDCFTSWKCYK